MKKKEIKTEIPKEENKRAKRRGKTGQNWKREAKMYGKGNV
jgi:hypothetical protein